MIEAMTPRDIQIAQLLMGVTVAVYIGLRFLPAGYRQAVGIALTIGYVAGIGVFMVYVLMR